MKLFSTPLATLQVSSSAATMVYSVIHKTIQQVHKEKQCSHKPAAKAAATLTLTCLLQIYRDKLSCDATDDANNMRRQPLAVFLYEWFLNKYGLPKLAEKQLSRLLNGVIRYQDESLYCFNFAKFTFVEDADTDPYLDV